MIIFFSLWLDSWQPFPGWFAIPVVLASAVLLLDFGNENWTQKLLSKAPLVLFGDISYSLYLVHWPLIVILRQKFGERDQVSLIAIAISILLSVLIYRLIEDPIRQSKLINGKRVALFSASLILVPIALVRMLPNFESNNQLNNSVSTQIPDEATLRQSEVTLGSNVCLDVHKIGLPDDISECIEGDLSLPTIFLVGDSHSLSASEGVIAAAKSVGFNVMTWSRSGCPFLVTSSVNRLCNGNRDYLLDAIGKSKPSAVLIVNGVNHYLEGLRDERFVPRGLKVRITETAAMYGETADYLLTRKIPTILMYEIPNLGENRPLSEFKLRSEIIAAINRSIKKSESKYGRTVTRVEPSDVLCPNGICEYSDENGRILYRDGQHLNADGSLRLKKLFEKVFSEISKN